MPLIQSEYIQFSGGLDLVTPNIAMPSGRMISGENFEIDQNGGYRRMQGYERADGRPSPSAAKYYHLPCSGITGVAAGNTITGFTSGATGYVIAVEASAIVFTKLTGTFVSAELIKVGGATVGTSTDVATESGSTSVQLHAQYNNLAADVYRADITAVPGSGVVRGVWYYSGVLYAFRNNAGGTAVDLYKSTSGGWTQVAFEYEVAFSNANTSVNDGDTLTQGGVTAAIRRVMVQTGTLLSGVNTGRLVISVPSGGNFAAGAATSTGGGALTLSGAQTAITLAVGGRFEFVTYNFGPGSRVYGCDGVNRAFEFDGSYFCPIATGMATDTPKFIAAHKNHLFLAFDRSLQHSGIGTPHTFTLLSGAAEINMGDTITGLSPQSGDASSGALAVFTRSQAYVLYGTSSSDWSLTLLQQDSGALPYTVASMGVTYVFDDRGVTQLGATQQFGNFQQATITSVIQPLIALRKSLVKAVSVSRDLNQIRYFFTDNTAIYMTIIGNRLMGVSQITLAHSVECICSLENSSGDEAIYFGSSNGYVYQMNKGTSFDGDDITAFFRTPFYHYKTPRLRKRFMTAVLEIRATDYMELSFAPELEYGSSDVEQPGTSAVAVSGGGAVWDVSYWDSMVWDGQEVTQQEMDLTGTSENMSMLVYSSGDYFAPFVVNSAIVHYMQRRQMR
jgi:hypothetical protein